MVPQWVEAAANASASVEAGSSDVTLCACVCVCVCVRVYVRTTLLIERLLHYYNRQEPPMKGRHAFQTDRNVSNVVCYAAVALGIAFIHPSVVPSGCRPSCSSSAESDKKLTIWGLITKNLKIILRCDNNLR